MIKSHYFSVPLLLATCIDFSYGQEQHAIGTVTSMPTVDSMWGYRAPASYQILPRPATHLNSRQSHVYKTPANPVESKPAQPYAYGWFGTQYSPQWHRQFGQQSSYTQWTLK